MTASPAAVPSPAELLQALIRFETVNPPGGEAACLTWVRELLGAHGITSELLAAEPDRPNLLARLPGRGQSPPLLLYGHVDVVGVAGQEWSRPPFAGDVVDGWVWGRGALDMKGGVAMLLHAFLSLAANGGAPAGDVLLALLSDEEAGGDLGARFLVERHPERLAGVRYALGEFGGFSLQLGSRRLYPIQIAEKRFCTLRLTVRGPGGHGSMPRPGGTMARLAAAVQALDSTPLPIRLTPPVRAMIETIADAADEEWEARLRGLLDPATVDVALAEMAPADALFAPILRHTAAPTIVRAGDKFNVVPALAELTVDGRVLPGRPDAEFLDDVRAVVGDDVELEVVRSETGRDAPDTGLFELLASVLREADPEGIPVPLVLMGATDGRIFDELGIQSYGFVPLRLPPDFAFLRHIHAADERVPVEALDFGAAAILRVLERYGG